MINTETTYTNEVMYRMEQRICSVTDRRDKSGNNFKD